MLFLQVMRHMSSFKEPKMAIPTETITVTPIINLIYAEVYYNKAYDTTENLTASPATVTIEFTSV